MKILLTALTALVLAAPALAAPPANDNRANAQLLPTFPAATHGTTVEATLERLDPQVSRCGRVDATVWYSIDAAPDGTIVASVQASGRLAPVVRIYRRNRSNIAEMACGTAAAGGKAVASVSTVRGAGYLILIGRRPGAADGEFDLRADLVLPPDNDERSEATPIRRLPATVHGTTLGAGADSYRACRSANGVWYRFKGPASGRVLVRLVTGNRDGVVVAFQKVRSDVEGIDCAGTDRRGNAELGFATKPGGDYLLLVADKVGSPPGAFVLTVRAAEAPERLPGRALRHGEAHGTVHGLTDVNDIWSMRLRRGRTYRIAFSSSSCVHASLQRGDKTLRRFACSGYTTFTPGPDGGGRYAIEITAAAATVRQAYRLRVVAAAPDDIGIGVRLGAGWRRGRLAPRGGDVVDLYHFEVERPSEVRLGLASGRSFSLLLFTDTGKRITFGGDSIRRRLDRGRYVVGIQGATGSSGGAYRLTLRLRDVTSTSVLISGRSSAEVAPGSAMTLGCAVSPTASGGRVELQIDRFDTLTGWHFYRVLRIAVGATVSWRPPTAGRWRVRARFLGTSRSAPSRSGYAHLLVAEPIR